MKPLGFLEIFFRIGILIFLGEVQGTSLLKSVFKASVLHMHKTLNWRQAGQVSCDLESLYLSPDMTPNLSRS